MREVKPVWGRCDGPDSRPRQVSPPGRPLMKAGGQTGPAARGICAQHLIEASSILPRVGLLCPGPVPPPPPPSPPPPYPHLPPTPTLTSPTPPHPHHPSLDFFPPADNWPLRCPGHLFSLLLGSSVSASAAMVIIRPLSVFVFAPCFLPFLPTKGYHICTVYDE